MDADLGHLEASLAALELQRQEAAAEAVAGAAAVGAGQDLPPLQPPSPPAPGSPPGPARSSDVEDATDGGLADGLSYLAAQDGGFPGSLGCREWGSGPLCNARHTLLVVL